ncbi:MAG TPA: bifunctional heptose 7-phosphate kinase/heptose 1-phosphate adenyltransferase [Sedimentisphaerales bacterium]|nr:bifunctional heptose 7-phosphate kinase/heptose 1-phosphate adenyltransferase [Sedimentisphaerales bacterium]
MYEGLLKTVTNLGSPKILIIGDFMLDIYTYGDAERISPESPVPVLKIKKTQYSCGGAGSVAADVSALEATPICLGFIGDDLNGKKLKDLLNENNADITGLITVQGRPTTSKQRLIGLAQHKHQQQIVRVDEESDEPFTNTQIDQLLKAYKDKLKVADVVCLQDHNKGLFTDSVCKQIITLAKQQGKKVLVDPALIKDYSKYAGATLITPNRKETSEAIGFKINTVEDAKKAAEKFMKELNLDAVVITLDKQGAYLKSSNFDELIETKVRDVYDVTGAGDMVLSTLAVTLAAKTDYKTAVNISNIAGGLEVGKFGAATVSVEEIIKEIAAQSYDNSRKILSFEEILKQVQWLHKQNKKIVFTNGCFDVIHRGHIELIKFSKTQGDVLILGLNSDSSIKALKGPERPINNQHDRATVLAALEDINFVCIFEEETPIKLIEAIVPDILIKGAHWSHNVVGQEFVEANGGKVVLMPIVEGKSSTSTIEKIKALGKNA